MKNPLFLSFALAISMSVAGCCGDYHDCADSTPAECREQVPQDEMCDAYFERWFYSEAENACTKIAYSGCSVKGFATQEECTACECVDDLDD